MARLIRTIATEIREDWSKIYFGAVPYLDAMDVIDTPDQLYFQDSGKDIITRFLLNAQSWRGAEARRIKAELRELIK